MLGRRDIAIVVLRFLSIRTAWICCRVCRDLRSWCIKSLHGAPRPTVVGGSKDDDPRGSPDGGGLLRSTETLDLSTLRWQVSALELPVPTMGAAACQLDDGGIVIFGGLQYNKDIIPVTSICLAHAMKNQRSAAGYHRGVNGDWTQKLDPPGYANTVCPDQTRHALEAASKPNACSGFLASLTDAASVKLQSGNMMIMGGVVKLRCDSCNQLGLRYDGQDSSMEDTGWLHMSVSDGAEELNTSTHAFTQRAPMAEPRMCFSANILPDGRVVIAGGCSQLNHLIASPVRLPIEEGGYHGGRHSSSGYPYAVPIDTAEIYDPVLNVWEALPPLPQPRAYATSCVLSDGRVALFGGLVAASRFKRSSFVGSPFVPAYARHNQSVPRWAQDSVPGTARDAQLAVATTAVAFDPAISQWGPISSGMPSGMQTIRMTATAVRRSVILSGGVMPFLRASSLGGPQDRGYQPRFVTGAMYIFDEESEAFFEMPHQLMVPRMAHTSLLVSTAQDIDNLSSEIRTLEELTRDAPQYSPHMTANFKTMRNYRTGSLEYPLHGPARSREWKGPHCPLLETIVSGQTPVQIYEALEEFFPSAAASIAFTVGGGIGNVRAWSSVLTSARQRNLSSNKWSASIRETGVGARAGFSVVKARGIWIPLQDAHNEKLARLATARQQLQALDRDWSSTI